MHTVGSYKFGDRLQSLLEVSGSRVNYVEEICSSSQASIQSGNSFNNLVPFSKYPYKDYEFGSGDLAESVKEEKKRKKMDAIADDMFNSEKGGRQRGLSGSLRRGLLHTRG
ncbi:hypothetical protein GOBAR_AA08148 [Gossypium barbadense]|uniref:Uncharacterized protein n=1 Tax=Gossypium barbadense TaxID=3634 RepID=A0A2P5YAB5_GOSBA|nr:hypothetical protein GOBAR_AA08148 [Gossypium barbadense]